LADLRVVVSILDRNETVTSALSLLLKSTSLHVDEVCDVVAKCNLLSIKNGQILHPNQCRVGSLCMGLVFDWTIADMEVALGKFLASFFSLAGINSACIGEGSMVDLRVGLEVALECHFVLRASLVTHINSPNSFLNPFDLLFENLSVLALLWGHKSSLVHTLVFE
jgi:hypothetical protein